MLDIDPFYKNKTPNLTLTSISVCFQQIRLISKLVLPVYHVVLNLEEEILTQLKKIESVKVAFNKFQLLPSI